MWGTILEIGAKILGIAQDLIGKKRDATIKQSGIDAATVKGQGDVLQNVEQAKRVEVAMQATAANPNGDWASSVHNQFRRPD